MYKMRELNSIPYRWSVSSQTLTHNTIFVLRMRSMQILANIPFHYLFFLLRSYVSVCQHSGCRAFLSLITCGCANFICKIEFSLGIYADHFALNAIRWVFLFWFFCENIFIRIYYTGWLWPKSDENARSRSFSQFICLRTENKKRDRGLNWFFFSFWRANFLAFFYSFSCFFLFRVVCTRLYSSL